MILWGGLQRNPFSFDITPVSNSISHLYFPLSLAPAAFWTHVRSDGGDIRVYKQDGTQIARQITGFDPVAKTGALWIKKDSGTAFRVKYGNVAWTEPAANSTYGSQNAWESALKLVMHCNDFADSTGNAQSISHSAGVTANESGKIGGAIKSTLATDYVAVAHNSSLVFSDLTAVTWINWSSTSSGRIFDKASGNNGFKLFVSDSSGGLVLAGYSTNISTSAGACPSGAWHQVAATIDSSGNGAIYVDGVSVKTGSTEAPSGIPAVDLKLFNRGDNLRPLIASADETRFYNRVLSPTEIADMYANQNTPATFWTIGSESQA